jgi:hypothetical protein
MSEGQLFEYVLNNRRAGDKAPVVVVRGTQRRELTMPIQE